jgi:hypothetical protein
MSIEALLDMDALVAAGDGTYTIAARGVSGSSAELRLWGLEIEMASGIATLRMFWEKSGGSQAAIDGPAFLPPSGYAYVAAVRRWKSATEVTVDYFVNGLAMDSYPSSDGDIENGVGGTVTVGVRGDGAGGWERHFVGTIDMVRVSADERTAEEIAAVTRFFFELPEQGYTLIKDYSPPGEVYSTHPDSIVQRELMTEGDGLAMAWSLIDELGRDFLPDRATRTLPRWERILRLSPKPSDFIAERRARAVGFLRKVHGYNRNEILLAVDELLAATEDQLAILENSLAWVDPFTDASLGLRWQPFTPGNGTLSLVSNKLRLTVPAATDCQWDGSVLHAVRARTSIDGAYGIIAAKLDAFTPADNGDMVGIYLQDEVSGDAHLFGIERLSGSARISSRIIKQGIQQAAVDLGAAPTLPALFRLKQKQAGLVDLQWNDFSDGWDTPWTTLSADVATVGNAPWCGVFARSGAASATGFAADIDEVRGVMPVSLSVFRWFVFRDPALGGDPDIRGAQLTIEKMEPAHTKGSITESNSFKCDDSYSLCDRTPLGGY